MSKLNIVDGPASEESLFLALSESRNGHTVLITSEQGKKLHVMITTLGVPEGRGKPWRVSGQARWDHVEKWDLNDDSVGYPIFEFSMTYFIENRRGTADLGKHVGDIWDK
ncbi:hypothetical protein A2853_02360 [Candidatus Kaiserbacteria bacterium RIFCSPHIGHO2_01_FULL_55_17]|uniref:Uncharacterized protein n=1 Tax=Candidatus Kaiserbacteria bacterium RIFCSPHIGHO2_01_FULL_55_17 TaxID=1798484 RepID=A0A1F6D7C9_9BACT|nr:MAG: hypothetical protein A2853_02360 [Candidatus Kaiserbacteria bacterium RIFCSPHIGHO2_01_FULL_55_17]